MKYRSFCWSFPAHAVAYAGGCNYHKHQTRRRKNCDTANAPSDPINRYESRWHSGRGGSFGVRRPLRYLAHRLELNDNQVRRLAAALNQLKTEREQAALDEKRTVVYLAGLLTEGTPTLEDCRTQLHGRVKAAEHMVDETAKAVVAISSLLDEDQQVEFVDLLLTGEFTL